MGKTSKGKAGKPAVSIGSAAKRRREAAKAAGGALQGIDSHGKAKFMTRDAAR